MNKARILTLWSQKIIQSCISQAAWCWHKTGEKNEPVRWRYKNPIFSKGTKGTQEGKVNIIDKWYWRNLIFTCLLTLDLSHTTYKNQRKVDRGLKLRMKLLSPPEEPQEKCPMAFAHLIFMFQKQKTKAKKLETQI